MTKTNNYSIFSFMQNNRNLNKGLVLRITNSIKEIGYIQARPIIVNSDMIIIDGQHRFEACKALGLPIFYEISDVDINKAMIALNMNQQIWRLEDYITSWASSGKKCYQDLLDFEAKYKFGISNAIVICKGIKSHSANDIRKGKDFVINDKKDDIAEFVLSCKPLFSFYKTKDFISSVELLFRKTTKENCLKVLNNIQPLRQQANSSNYLAFYENILNKRKRNGDNMIALF